MRSAHSTDIFVIERLDINGEVTISRAITYKSSADEIEDARFLAEEATRQQDMSEIRKP